MWRALSVSGLLMSIVVSAGAARADNAPKVLPLMRVRLYEAGVAYFERSGSVGSTALLPVPRSHLDDALKTLVILDGDGKASVTGVEMEQPATSAHGRALAGLPEDEAQELSFDRYLGSLEGERVELALAGGPARGQLVRVLRSEESGLTRCRASDDAAEGERAPCSIEPQTALLFLSDGGEVKRVATSELKGVTPLDVLVQQRLRGAARARTGSATNEHALTVKLRSGSNVTLGYVAEAPLFRTSYRLLLGAKEPTLQGFALIHNDTDEAWRGVRVELVNGQPDSFLFPLAAPRYATRRLVTPEQHLPSVPQLLGQTADDQWDGGGGGEVGFGVGLGGIGVVGRGEGGGGLGEAARHPDESSLLEVGNLAAQDASEGAQIGALFRYALSQSVDLGAKRSLLVPFLREPVAARRIAWFEAPDAPAKSTILLRNTSSQTLPPGPIALFEGGGFAGESAIDRFEPAATRLVHFGTDLDVTLSAKNERGSEQLRILSFEHGKLVEHYVRRTERTVALVNRGAVARTVHLRLELVNNSKVSGADSVYVDADADTVDAVFELAATTRKSYELGVEEGLEREIPAAELGSALVQRLLREKLLPPPQRDVLGRALPHFQRYESALKRRNDLGLRLRRLDERLKRLASTLDVVRRADEDQGELQAEELVKGEAERARLVAAIDATATEPPLAQAKRELQQLRAR
jgi:hypothetical protein